LPHPDNIEVLHVKLDARQTLFTFAAFMRFVVGAPALKR